MGCPDLILSKMIIYLYQALAIYLVRPHFPIHIGKVLSLVSWQNIFLGSDPPLIFSTVTMPCIGWVHFFPLANF